MEGVETRKISCLVDDSLPSHVVTCSIKFRLEQYSLGLAQIVYALYDFFISEFAVVDESCNKAVRNRDVFVSLLFLNRRVS